MHFPFLIRTKQRWGAAPREIARLCRNTSVSLDRCAHQAAAAADGRRVGFSIPPNRRSSHSHLFKYAIWRYQSRFRRCQCFHWTVTVELSFKTMRSLGKFDTDLNPGENRTSFGGIKLRSKFRTKDQKEMIFPDAGAETSQTIARTKVR